MRFIAAFASSLALAAGAHAAMEAADMVNNINQITDISSDANDIAKSLSAINVFQKAPVCSFSYPKKRSTGAVF